MNAACKLSEHAEPKQRMELERDVEGYGPLELGPDAIATGVRVFRRIARAWQLSPDHEARLLGLADAAELERLAGMPETFASDERFERLSYVFGIWRALNSLLGESTIADTWLSRPNTAAPFGGRPARDLMTTGRIEDLRAVHQYLMSEIS